MCMDQLHALLLRQALQAADIGPDHEWILGMERQPEGGDAELAGLDLAASAARRHDGRPAMLDQMVRQIEGVPLRAAIAQRRQDLEDTRSCSTLARLPGRLHPVAHPGDAANMKRPASQTGLPPCPSHAFWRSRRIAGSPITASRAVVQRCCSAAATPPI